MMGDLDQIQTAEFREAFEEFDKVKISFICTNVSIINNTRTGDWIQNQGPIQNLEATLDHVNLVFI